MGGDFNIIVNNDLYNNWYLEIRKSKNNLHWQSLEIRGKNGSLHCTMAKPLSKLSIT